MNYEDFIKTVTNQMGDDPWFFFSIAINEYKIFAEFGRTNISLIVSIIKDILRRNRKLLLELKTLLEGDLRISDIGEFFRVLYDYIRKLKNEIVDYCNRERIELKLLETNDLAKQDHYLTQLLYVSLSTIKHQNLLDKILNQS